MAKKNTGSEMAMPKPPEPTTTICMSKEQAGDVSVGDKVSVTVSGEVVGIERRYDDEKRFDVRLKGTRVDWIEGNRADKALKEMGN